MVNIDGRNSGGFQVERLMVEQLEERCVLALPWPVESTLITGIDATYGQFDDRFTGQRARIHFHEGIDVLVRNAATEVYSIEKGTVTKIQSALGGNPYHSWVSIATTNANRGWNYAHIEPNAKLVQGKEYDAGTFLGTVTVHGAVDGLQQWLLGLIV